MTESPSAPQSGLLSGIQEGAAGKLRKVNDSEKNYKNKDASTVMMYVYDNFFLIDFDAYYYYKVVHKESCDIIDVMQKEQQPKAKPFSDQNSRPSFRPRVAVEAAARPRSKRQ